MFWMQSIKCVSSLSDKNSDLLHPIILLSQAKESLGLYVFHDEVSKPPSTQTQLGASLIAGFTATACSLPFDLLKSRMRKFYLVSGYIFIPVVAMSISIHSVHLHPNSKQKYMLKLLLLLLYQLQRMVADIRD